MNEEIKKEKCPQCGDTLKWTVGGNKDDPQHRAEKWKCACCGHIWPKETIRPSLGILKSRGEGFVLDWNGFENKPKTRVVCNCGQIFKSHIQNITSDYPTLVKTYVRESCPGCHKYNAAIAIHPLSQGVPQ